MPVPWLATIFRMPVLVLVAMPDPINMSKESMEPALIVP
jgi:hypothetical protein